MAAQTGDLWVNANNFTNTNGAVYAKGVLKVGAQSLDNTAGQMAGGAIDLSSNAALTNRTGVIESDSTLSITASSLDNGGGKLRALGRDGKTQFQIGSVFDNRSGVVETANTEHCLCPRRAGPAAPTASRRLF